ncbi:MAG: type II restriction endonuclease [Elusimicrobiota bacterium]|nr:type II restriction endonuclease [Elusimicrobiota bacterium]
MNKTKLGSKTAKGGFANEKDICKKFNNWKKDTLAQEWLKIMGYQPDKVDSVNATQIPTRMKKADLCKFGFSECEYNDFMRFKKADAQIRIVITIGEILKIENLSLKKANSNADYNQVDKRTVDMYQVMWGFNDDIALWLKLFTGEKNLFNNRTLLCGIKMRDKRRVFLNEMPINMQEKIIKFFTVNKILVVSDILKGRGGFSADWMLITKNKQDMSNSWVLKDINTVMNFFGGGDVKISKKGSLYIGKITMQRKGGTPDPTKLQFKIHPCNLFFLESKNEN